jgi:hypothetical protein
MPPKQLDHEEKVNPIEPDYLLAVSHIGFWTTAINSVMEEWENQEIYLHKVNIGMKYKKVREAKI